MGFFVWIILIVVGIFVFEIIKVAPTTNKMIKAKEKRLANLDGFDPSQKVMGNDGNSGIAINESEKKVCLITSSMLNVDLDILAYGDILSSEIFEDGVTITKTDRESQIRGALIGGLVLGGAGAIIGGLSGKTTSSNKVKRIDLRITVNRTNNPIHDINFMNEESKKNGSRYKKAMEHARYWHALLTVLIKRADSEDIAKERKLVKDKTDLSPNRSITDEIAKLSELLKQGLLTDEEFKAQKAKLLK